MRRRPSGMSRGPTISTATCMMAWSMTPVSSRPPTKVPSSRSIARPRLRLWNTQRRFVRYATATETAQAITLAGSLCTPRSVCSPPYTPMFTSVVTPPKNR